MFLLTHAIMATDYKYSSRAFFRFKNADAKFQFLDKLCEAHFSTTILEAEWQPIRTQLNDGIHFRNYVAHYEISYVRDVTRVPAGDPPVVLVPHHLDQRIRDEPMIRAVNLTELRQWGENYRALAHSLISLVQRHFSLEKLQTTHLPPEWLNFLATEEI